jgi:hypothetical protein
MFGFLLELNGRSGDKNHEIGYVSRSEKSKEGDPNSTPLHHINDKETKGILVEHTLSIDSKQAID